MIGSYLTEINVTSPTCFQEIYDQTGYDVAVQFVNAMEEYIEGALPNVEELGNIRAETEGYVD